MAENVLVTGVAGFIGYHVAARLLDEGCRVTGIDNLNAYYDPALKQARLDRISGRNGFRFEKMDLADRDAIAALFAEVKPSHVVHLGAQAGVRYSLENPHAYADSNVTGTLNILEGCRHNPVAHLVYASSSSVYGANTKYPFAVSDSVDHPVSLYAASKKANELFAHSYSHLYRIPATGLRFFTVYGPWGRPDMAVFKFVQAILAGRPIDVYNGGEMWRDFTYIDDIVEGVVRVMRLPAAPDPAWTGDNPDPATSNAPWRVFNIGNNAPVKLADMIAALERCLGVEARKTMLPMQPGDVLKTFADIDALQAAVGFRPDTPLEAGLQRFVDWYRAYYGV